MNTSFGGTSGLLTGSFFIYKKKKTIN